MKEKKDSIYQCASFYMTRIASLAIQTLDDCMQTCLDTSVFDVYQTEDLFHEAVFFASPSLRSVLAKEKNSQHVRNSLFKYLLRSTTRATPFGLFSSVAFCEWNLPSKSIWKPNDLKSSMRIDMDWWDRFLRSLSKNPQYQKYLYFRKNPHLTISGGRISLHLVETKGKKVGVKKVSIRLTPIVRLILELTQTPQSFSSLCLAMRESLSEIDTSKIKIMGQALLDQGVLIYAIPSLLQEDFFSKIKLPPFQKSFQELKQDLIQYHAISPGKGADWIAQTEKKLSTLVTEVNVSKALHQDLMQNSLQVDLYNPFTCAFLPEHVAQEVGLAADLFWKFSYVFKDLHDLQSYHNAFLEKYGVSRIISISELISSDSGLGLPSIYTKDPEPKNLGHGWKNWLKKKLFAVLRSQAVEMVLSDTDLDLLIPDYDVDKAPPSCDLFFSLSADPHQTSEYFVVLHTLVQQGMSSFGRFMHLLGSEQKKKMQKAYQQEENLLQEFHFVETSFFPKNSRAANIAMHKSCRKHTLDLVEPEKGNVFLDEMYVGATESYLFLANQKGEPLFATSGNVLNPSYAPPILRLIRDISKMRYIHHYPWSWMGFEDAPFLPRVRYKNIVLARAQWIFDLPLDQLKKHQREKTLFKEFNRWADAWNVPEQFYLGFNDHCLLVNRKQLAYESLLVKEIEKNAYILLRESLGGPWIQGPKGNHCAEFVAPVIKKSPYKKRFASRVVPLEVDSTFRRKQIGSEWLYFKLYLSMENNTSFILHQLSAFISQFETHDAFKGWYFIRYLDPNNHLRVRIHAESSFLITSVIPVLGKWMEELHDHKYITQCDICVYEREIERYGGTALMEVTETIFCNDTQVCLALIQAMKRKQLQLPPAIIGALSIIDFMGHLDLSLEKLIEFFTLPTQNNKQTLKNFREWKKELPFFIKAILKKDVSVAKDMQVLVPIFALRSSAFTVYKKLMKKLKSTGDIPKDYGYVLQSLIHMHVNRLLGYEQEHEIKVRTLAYYGLVSLHHVNKQAANEKKTKVQEVLF